MRCVWAAFAVWMIDADGGGCVGAVYRWLRERRVRGHAYACYRADALLAMKLALAATEPALCLPVQLWRGRSRIL